MSTGSERSAGQSRAAVDKACGLLSAFSSDGDGVVGVSELARRAGLTKSTAHRQLGILERAAMVERSGRGYRIGRRLRALAREVCEGRHARLADVLLPYLVELFEATRRTVQLAALDGTEVVYLGKVCGHRTIATPARVGGRLPAHCTAGGKLLLAHHPVAAAEVLASPLRRLTPVTICDPEQLDVELSEIRRRGIAFDSGGSRLGLWCVASRITSPWAEPLAAMSVCVPRGTNIGAICAVLQQITATASRHVAEVSAGNSKEVPEQSRTIDTEPARRH